MRVILTPDGWTLLTPYRSVLVRKGIINLLAICAMLILLPFVLILAKLILWVGKSITRRRRSRFVDPPERPGGSAARPVKPDSPTLLTSGSRQGLPGSQ